MLAKFVDEWNKALDERIVNTRFEGGDGSIRQQCVLQFRDTEIITTEVWDKDANLENLVMFVPSTGKFIKAKYADAGNNMNWKTMAAVMNGIIIGTANEDQCALRHELQLSNISEKLISEYTAALNKVYKENEVEIFIEILKLHIKADNIMRARVIMNVLTKFSNEIIGNRLDKDGYRFNYNSYIDKMYAMFVSIVNRRYVRNNMFTINLKDCDYLFRREISPANIPPIFQRIREVTSAIYDACGNSTNFVYLADALCAFYSVVTCVPYEIKLAEVQAREQSVKARKQRNISAATDGNIGRLSDVPSSIVLNKLKLN